MSGSCLKIYYAKLNKKKYIYNELLQNLRLDWFASSRGIILLLIGLGELIIRLLYKFVRIKQLNLPRDWSGIVNRCIDHTNGGRTFRLTTITTKWNYHFQPEPNSAV